jgi:DNA (cytosine-5)-methyltransferase 1
LSGNSKESKQKRKATSPDAEGGTGSGGFRMTAFGQYADDDTASTLKQRDYKDATDLVAHKPSWWNGEQTAATLTKQNANGAQRMPDKDNFGAVLEPIAYENHAQDSRVMEMGETCTTVSAQQPTMAIRRLTPRECERLQGFPDDWTLIPYRNKSADQCPDGPRYKACGNSMAVPVMRWIGQRIEMVEKLIADQ